MNKMNKDKGPHKAKNKPSIETKENDFEVAGNISADERKTVIVDKDFENLEFDDKVWLWWRENKVSVIAAIIASFAIIILVGAYKYLQEQKLQDAKAEYTLSVNDSTKLEAFAKKYSGLELAGVAQLEVANKAYAEANYAKAQEAYSLAANELEESELGAKATIGIAFSQLKQGKKTDATNTLRTLTQQEGVNPAFKAEASYQLAVLEFSNGEKSTAKGLFDALVQNPQAGTWARQAQEFLMLNY